MHICKKTITLVCTLVLATFSSPLCWSQTTGEHQNSSSTQVTHQESKAGSTLLYKTHIEFTDSDKVKIQFEDNGQSKDDVMSTQIYSALVLYAHTMHKLSENERIPLLNQIQRSAQKVATDKGLQRANLITNNSFANLQGKKLGQQNVEISYNKEKNNVKTMLVNSSEENTQLLSAATFYLFQELTDKLPENGLRLFVLSVVAMNKCYREVASCQANDPNSIAAAPQYGLEQAVNILNRVTGSEIK